MIKNNFVPKRRFKEFRDTGDWEQKKFRELTDNFEYGLNASAKEFDGVHKYIRITDIDDKNHIFIQSGLTSPDIDFTKADNYKLQRGDILFARTGASVGKTYLYRESDGLVYYAGFLIRARIKSNFDSEFVFQNTLTDNYDQFIKITSQRSGQPGVNAEEYSNFKIMVPSYEEQVEIGNFFSQLDDTIVLQQRKLEKLKSLKAAYLAEMFPEEGEKKPKRRFKGFINDWEQRRLYDSIKVMDGDRGSNYPHESDFLENGDILFLDTGNVTKNGFKFDSVKYITKEKDEQLRAGKLDMNDFVLTSRGTLGNVGYYDEIVYKLHPKIRINSAMLILRNRDEHLSYSYLHTLLKGKLISDFMRNNQVGSAQPHITKSDFMKLELNVPHDIEEQNKIGDFFKILDKTIALHHYKLEKLKNLKKAYLSEMFL